MTKFVREKKAEGVCAHQKDPDEYADFRVGEPPIEKGGSGDDLFDTEGKILIYLIKLIFFIFLFMFLFSCIIK